MTYRGHVKGGVIVLDEHVSLEEGTEVSIEVMGDRVTSGGDIRKARFEALRPFIGIIKDAPSDWSENHDAYLGGEHLR